MRNPRSPVSRSSSAPNLDFTRYNKILFANRAVKKFFVIPHPYVQGTCRAEINKARARRANSIRIKR